MKPILTVSAAFSLSLASAAAFAQDAKGLWSVYDDALKGAKYIDLTHVIAPNIPVWFGFGPSKFMPTQAGSDIEGYAKKGDAYSYEKHGFEATHYDLVTDQLGTQLDPPAHWAPEYPSIDELPATYAVRPLVVISIVDKVASDPGYHLQVADIEAFEKEHGHDPRRLGRVRPLRLVEDLARPGARDDEAVPRRVARRAEISARAAKHSLPRPRAARHRHDADARGRGVADAQRLCAGGGRRQSRWGAGDRLPGEHRLSEIRRRDRRLCALRRDLPARYADRGYDRRSRCTAAEVRQAAALG